MNKIRVADILASGIEKYQEERKLSWKQKKVLDKITTCCKSNVIRQKIACSSSTCDYVDERVAPCGDRHCNHCNNSKMLKWLSKMLNDFLPLPFHHIVFTMPSELRNLTLCNKEVVYDLFFKSSFEVLKKFARDEKHFGGELGFIGLLHTWGQTLCYHPHLHFMVLSGGIKNGEYCRLPYSKKFLFPVKAMSKVMMGVFVEKLKEAYTDNKLIFPGGLEEHSSAKAFNWFLYNLSKKKWVIFNQAPINGSPRVFEYLSRYTHRVAISNRRIKSHSCGKVVFEYKDYKSKDRKGRYLKKTMSLSETEFIRRYLLHILPNGFRKLRYGGIFASNRKKESISIIKNYFADVLEKLTLTTNQWYARVKKYITKLCPECEAKLFFKCYAINSS